VQRAYQEGKDIADLIAIVQSIFKTIEEIPEKKGCGIGQGSLINFKVTHTYALLQKYLLNDNQ
jgi:hypothetical protein